MIKRFIMIFFIIFSQFLFSAEDEFSSSEKFIKVNGIVKNMEYSLGNATVTFINSENKVYNTKSDFAGNFTIFLPKTRYKVLGEKPGYTMEKFNQMFYDFSKFKESTNIVINLAQIPSLIQGRVIDENGNPIKKAKVMIKFKDSIKTIETDHFGMFSSDAPSGLISIFVEKDGYFGNGTAIFLENETLRNNISIKLQRKFYSISGVLTDGIEPLSNETIYLLDGKSKKILEKTQSSINGYYEFLNIPGASTVNILVPEIPGYKKLITPNIEVHENINKYNLFLN